MQVHGPRKPHGLTSPHRLAASGFRITCHHLSNNADGAQGAIQIGFPPQSPLGRKARKVGAGKTAPQSNNNDDGRRGMAVDSLVSGGCIISGGSVRRSVLFSKVYIHSYAEVEEAVLLPEVDVGRGCKLRKVVIDNGCVIPEGMQIGFDAAEDTRRFYRTDSGVVLVTREMLEKLQ